MVGEQEVQGSFEVEIEIESRFNKLVSSESDSRISEIAVD